MPRSTASDLDLFLLAMISSGLSTAYELKSRAGVSLGTTLPALDRLCTVGLIEADDPGPRRSRRFKATKAGVKQLKAYWKDMLNQRVISPDEVFRIAYLALSQGGTDTASSFLTRAAEDLSARATAKAAEADAVSRESRDPDGPSWYCSLKLRCEATGVAAQAHLLADFAAEMRTRQRRKKRP